MRTSLAKALRTAQTMTPGLVEHKAALQRFWRLARRTPFEPEFNALPTLTLGSSPVCIDIGANRGQSIDALRMVLPACTIESFEPNPTLFAKLQRQVRPDDGVTLHNFGLASKPGQFVLYIPSYNGFVFDGLASFEEAQARDWLRARIYNYRDSKLEIRRVLCEVRTLDSFDLAPHFVKADVQGYEYEALLGGQRTLERHRPVLLIEAPSMGARQWLLRMGYTEHSFDGRRLTAEPSRTGLWFYIPKVRRAE